MRYLVIIFLICFGCTRNTERPLSKAEVAQQQKMITLWMDSLLATTSTFTLSADEEAILLRSQERYFPKYNYRNNVYLTLSKDSVGIRFREYFSLEDEFEEFTDLFDRYTENLKEKQRTAPENQIVVTLQIRKECPIQNVQKILTLCQQMRYTMVVFVGEFKTQHKAPQIHDPAYFNEIITHIECLPAAKRATAFADFVQKKMDKYQEVKQIWDTLGYLPSEQRETFACKNLPTALADKRDYKFYTTIYYVLYGQNPRKKTVQGGGRAFYIDPQKKILEGTSGVWSDISDSIFSLENDTLTAQNRIRHRKR